MIWHVHEAVYMNEDAKQTTSWIIQKGKKFR